MIKCEKSFDHEIEINETQIGLGFSVLLSTSGISCLNHLDLTRPCNDWKWADRTEWFCWSQTRKKCDSRYDKSSRRWALISFKTHLKYHFSLKETENTNGLTNSNKWNCVSFWDCYYSSYFGLQSLPISILHNHNKIALYVPGLIILLPSTSLASAGTLSALCNDLCMAE